MAAPTPNPEAALARLMQLRVRVRPHVRVHRHEYRGQAWFVIEDPASGRAHRISPAANEVLGLLDGVRTLNEVVDEAKRRQGEEAPTPQDLVALVGTLYRADLVVADARPDLEELAARGQRLRGMKLRQYFLNPLSMRFPLIDPDRFLSRVAQSLSPVPPAAWIAVWSVTVLFGVIIAAQNWEALSNGFADRVLSTENLFLLWFCYPIVKLLHEIGHGIAIRRFGGQVHEMGVMLLVLVPVPYVEASAAAAFPAKRARMLVGAAGVLTELFLAGVAMIIWALVEPGLIHAVCFNVALIAGVSTLLFNGNPLMRFDGYYVFSDLVEIPNLGQRSTAFVGYMVQRYAFGMRDLHSSATSRGEARWLLLYGCASFIYRIFISFSIILLVASKYFFAGVLLAIWGVALMIVRPIVAGVLYLSASQALAGHRRRAVRVTASVVVSALAVLFLVPVPQWSRAEGVVWVPERAQVRAASGCWVRDILAQPGSRVVKGDPLVRCDDPELETGTRVLEAELSELRARDAAYFVESRLRLDIVREELAVTAARLADSQRKLEALTLRSPVTGTFVFDRPRDAPGRYAKRGDLVAYVVEDGPATVRVVVEQDDVDLVRSETRGVVIKPADRVAETLSARIRRQVPGATDRLPSAALGVPGGGQFGIDPRGLADPDAAERPKVMTPVFQFDLEVEPDVRLDALGMRVFVKFQLEPTPVGVQVFRAARRLLLRRFEV